MDDLLYNQFKTIIVFFISGLSIGFTFDFFRALRRIIKTSNIVTYIEDILFWIISGLIIIVTTVTYTDGQIRSFMIIGLILGIVVYFYVFSKFVIKLEINISKLMCKIYSILVYPLKKLLKILKKAGNN
ncbi:MAG: spore cortex biosynthesis protein YabQ [Clostridia bacterium]|nr:spore cortex biosynthesis protein YabQ [Clostridia bacterium]